MGRRPALAKIADRRALLKSFHSSTLLLLRLARWRIAIGMAAAFCLMFFIGLDNFISSAEAVSIVLFLGFGFTFLMRPQKLLSGLMFPVTDRQLAFIPWGVSAIVTFSAMAGMMLGQVISYVDTMTFAEMLEFWLESTRYWPVLTFLILLTGRVILINPTNIGVLPVSFFSLSKAYKTYEEVASPWMDRLVDAWPLWMLGCGFLLYEAPRLTAALRRLEQGDGSWLDSMNQKAQLQSPIRLAAVSCIANATTGILLAAAVVYYVFVPLDLTASSSDLMTTLTSYWPILIIPAVILQYAIRIMWQTNRASGMTRSRAFQVLLLELTIVGYAFRDRLGVARGTVGECVHCGNPRMA